MTTSYRGSLRQEANDASKTSADNDRLEWDRPEDELLQTWDHSEAELDLMSEILGRTREACRQRYYEVRSGRCTSRVRTSVVIQRRLTTISNSTVAVTAYYYERWSDADEYNPEWYR